MKRAARADSAHINEHRTNECDVVVRKKEKRERNISNNIRGEQTKSNRGESQFEKIEDDRRRGEKFCKNEKRERKRRLNRVR